MGIRRRIFLAGLGGTGLGFGLGGLSHLFPLPSPEVGPEWSPGEEGFVPSTCMLCPSHCGVLGRVVDGSLVQIGGNPLHPVSRGGLCAKGKASVQLLYHPARLTGPLRRADGRGDDGFEPVTWDEALERIGGRLRALREQGRPGRAAWLAGDVQAGLGDLLRRFLDSYGTPHLLHESYDDGSSDVIDLTQGVASQPAFDLDRADLILSFGAPLAEAWWCMPQAAGARDGKSARRWVQVDTRLSRTAVAADHWVPIRPGSFGALAIGIAYVMLKEGLYDGEWLENGTRGFEDWTDADGQLVPGFRSLILRHGRSEAVSAETGVPVEEIVQLAKEFGRAERPLAVWDQVVAWRRGGLAAALAIHSLNTLSGSLRRPGGVYVQPPLPAGSLGDIARPIAASRGVAPGFDETDWVDRVIESEESPIDVLFLHHANPAASSPRPERVREALEKIPLVVSFSPFLDESSRKADLVLPDHTYLERWQDALAPASVPYPVWNVVQPIVQPLHDTRATGDVILQLASLLGEDVAEACPWSDMAELVRQRGRDLARANRGSAFVSAFRRDELREMEARGWWIPHGQSPSSFWESVRESGGWFDPYHDDHGREAASRHADGKVALFPVEARERIAAGLPGLAGGFLPLRGTATEDGAEGVLAEGDEYPLKLNPYRLMTLASGTTGLTPWLLENLGPLTATAWQPWVEINPRTARALELETERTVRVVSPHGGFTALLRAHEGAQPGVLNAPYGLHSSVDGWGAVATANPLVTVGSARDPLTGLPDWYGTRVRVEEV